MTRLPDLWLTGWFLGRKQPLRVWGPAGTRRLTKYLAEAFHFDLDIRKKTEGLPSKGAEIEAHEIDPEMSHENESARVTAFPADHGPVQPAVGYRIDYAGHSLVISGDTKFSPELIRISKGTDCLVQVAWKAGATNPTPPGLRSLASAEDAGRTFTAVRPRLAVVYHYKEKNSLENAIRGTYAGPLVIAQDLMTIVIGRTVVWKNGANSGALK